MTTNYLSVSMDLLDRDGNKIGRIAESFFFNDRNPDGVRAAFENATTALVAAEDLSPQMAFFKQPKLAGIWDGIPIIGEATSDLGPEV